jgi:hypothetical protein
VDKRVLIQVDMVAITFFTVAIVIGGILFAWFSRNRHNSVSNSVQINVHVAKPLLPGGTQRKFDLLMAALQEAEAPVVTDEQITQIFGYFNEINAAKREIENELEELTSSYFNGKVSIGVYNQRLDSFLSRLHNLKYTLAHVG